MTSRRYGMAHHTIQYFQGQGKLLRDLRGHIPVDVMGRSYGMRYETMPPQKLAHLIIALAVVCTPHELRHYLTARP